MNPVTSAPSSSRLTSQKPGIHRSRLVTERSRPSRAPYTERRGASWLRPLEPRDPIPSRGPEVVEVNDEGPARDPVGNHDSNVAFACVVWRAPIWCDVRECHANLAVRLATDCQGRSPGEPGFVVKRRSGAQASRFRQILAAELIVFRHADICDRG